MMELPTLIDGSDVQIVAKAYSFRFKGYGNWAIFTLNDYTGELNIQSDWGCYAYRWNTGTLGDHTLTTFISTCEPEYIVRKLQQNNKHELDRVIDSEGTRKALCKYLDEVATEENEDEIAQARDEITNWSDDDFSEYVYQHLECLPDIIDDVGELLCYKRSISYEFLEYRLLPFFQNWLRLHLQKNEAEACALIKQS